MRSWMILMFAIQGMASPLTKVMGRRITSKRYDLVAFPLCIERPFALGSCKKPSFDLDFSRRSPKELTITKSWLIQLVFKAFRVDARDLASRSFFQPTYEYEQPAIVVLSCQALHQSFAEQEPKETMLPSEKPERFSGDSFTRFE